MALLSFLKRKAPQPAAAALPDEAAASARTGARRRLIGAAVLLAVGVIAFPLLFETQPRAIPVDLPIEIPRKDAVAPLPPPPKSAKVAPAAAAPASAVDIAPAAVAEPVAAVTAPVPTPTTSASGSKPAPKPAAEPKSPPTAALTAKDAERAKALLEAKPATSAVKAAPTLPAATVATAAAASDSRGARFVVQVGAFADVAAVREARSKVEALGLKTYAQAVETDKGTRTRVRAGPFETREEALKVQARLKAAGLPGAVLAL